MCASCRQCLSLSNQLLVIILEVIYLDVQASCEFMRMYLLSVYVHVSRDQCTYAPVERVFVVYV